MKILLSYRVNYDNGKPVETYARSFHYYLERLGHQVIGVGEGHKINTLEVGLPADLIVEIECGRNKEGKFNYLVPGNKSSKFPPTMVWLIDSHGQGELHSSIMDKYTHVFFAVFSKRDIFAKHPSAYFLPSATDLRWFGRDNFTHITKQFDVGFHGSKKGLSRADKLKEICQENNWKYDIRQVTNQYKHNIWPATGEAMSACSLLFNRSQKHDINQRIFESMAVGRPLINDLDYSSGIRKLFKPERHFLSYDPVTFAGLKDQIKYCLNNPVKANKIAENAYQEILDKHLISHRINTMLEIIRLQ